MEEKCYQLLTKGNCSVSLCGWACLNCDKVVQCRETQVVVN